MPSGTTDRLRASGGPSEHLLLLLNDHRVMTTDQLARATATPARTVLYRLEQLRTAGLVDYDRPGRQRGSAPHHWRLRPAGARLVTGTSPADGRRPSALFSAHAATITEVWLAVREHGPAAGLTLTGWATDRAGWQEWDGPTSRWGGTSVKRLTPDAVYEAVLADGRAVAAFIEVDLASMTQTQLRAKLDRYRAYARDEAWRGRFPHCPPLLLLTTTAHRAVTFTRNAARHLGETSSAPTYGRRLVDDFDLIAAHGRLVVAAAGCVRDPARAVTEHAWTLTDPEAPEVTLTAICTERATTAAAAGPAYQRQEAEAERLQRDEVLRRIRVNPRPLLPLLGPAAVDLVSYLLDTRHDPADAFTPRLDADATLDTLAQWWRRTPRSGVDTPALGATLTRLHHQGWSHQVRQLARLAATGEDRPAWYAAAAHLARRSLLTPAEHHRLHDARSRDAAQAQVWSYWQPPGHRDEATPVTYPQWRDQQVTAEWTHLSWWQRQRTDPTALAAAFDTEHLTACARCALTIPATDTGDCPGCHHTQRLPHEQRHTVTPLTDLVAALLADATGHPYQA